MGAGLAARASGRPWRPERHPKCAPGSRRLREHLVRARFPRGDSVARRVLYRDLRYAECWRDAGRGTRRDKGHAACPPPFRANILNSAMTPMTRRSFTISAVAAASLQMPAFGRKLSTFGVQLYTVRSIINKDPQHVLNEIEAAGYKEIEATNENLAKIMDAAHKTKMRPVSIHLDTDLFTKQRDKLGPVLDDMKKR